MLNMQPIQISPINYSNALMQRTKHVLASLSLAVLMSGCASIQSIENTTSEGPMRTLEVSITRRTVIAGTPDAVFNFITAEDVLPKVLTGYGPLPAVVKTSENTGPWTLAGSTRLIHLADGSTVREQVTYFEPSERFSYRVWEFGNPLIRTLATGARGEWIFSSAPGGTLVTWTYTSTAKNAVSLLPLSAITKILWRGYMDICLKNSKHLMAKS
jgi:Polyketide cyclase / dehydrase and lipid transport